MRYILYVRLRAEFGCYKSWLQVSCPYAKGDNAELKRYNDFLANAAVTMSFISGKPINDFAVRQQIMFALTRQEEIRLSHARSFFLNKSVALETGFISRRHLPNVMLMEPAL